MSKITATFSAELREKTGRGAARAARRQKLVPGVVYGCGGTVQSIQLDPRQLIPLLRKPGFYSQQYELDINGTKTRVMAQDVQFHVVSDDVWHVDFLRIDVNTEVTTVVPVIFLNQGVSPGLKNGGVLNVVRHKIEVIAKPDDLPEYVEIDLAEVALNESVRFSAISLPTGVRPAITGRDFVIANIAAPSRLKSEQTSGKDEDQAEE